LRFVPRAPCPCATLTVPCLRASCSARSMQLLQCCPVCREACAESDLRKNLVLQQLADHFELLPARLCARLVHPSGDRSAADMLRRKQSALRPATTAAKLISGKWNYHLKSETELRIACRQYGLPDKGDKKTLERLHREFVIRFNAQVDRGIPRSEPDIRSQVRDAFAPAYMLESCPFLFAFFQTLGDPVEVHIRWRERSWPSSTARTQAGRGVAPTFSSALLLRARRSPAVARAGPTAPVLLKAVQLPIRICFRS